MRREGLRGAPREQHHDGGANNVDGMVDRRLSALQSLQGKVSRSGGELWQSRGALITRLQLMPKVQLAEDVGKLRELNKKLEKECVLEVTDNTKLKGEFK